MAFNSLADFFVMGGYATFVWSAYCFVLVSLISAHYIVRLRNRRLERQLKIIDD